MADVPRKKQGGPRQGKPGGAYPNRTDLRQPKPPVGRYVGQPYGAQKAQVDAQQAVPVAGTAMPVPPSEPGPPSPGPGSLGDLLGPTARPNESLSAGLPNGPGPGPEALQMAGASSNPDLVQLRAVYQAHPSPALRDLIDYMDSNP